MNNKNFKQFLKFATVGISNVVIGYSCFMFFSSYMSFSIFTAQCIAYSIGVTWSYIANSIWTFSSSNASYFSYVVFQAAQLFGSAIIIDKLVHHIDKSTAWIATMCVFTVVNFLGLKLFIYQTRS